MAEPVTLTRRALLGTAAASALLVAGCRSTPPRPGASADLEGALRAATSRSPLLDQLAEMRTLLASYDSAIAAAPALAGLLQPLRADHADHLTALTGGSPAGTPLALPDPATIPSAQRSAAADTLAGLVAAEKTMRDAYRSRCLTGAADSARLNGSISVCCDEHVSILQGAKASQ